LSAPGSLGASPDSSAAIPISTRPSQRSGLSACSINSPQSCFPTVRGRNGPTYSPIRAFTRHQPSKRFSPILNRKGPTSPASTQGSSPPLVRWPTGDSARRGGLGLQALGGVPRRQVSTSNLATATDQEMSANQDR